MGTYTKFKANLVIDVRFQNVCEIISSLMDPESYFGPVTEDRPKIGMVHEFFVSDRATCIFLDMNDEFKITNWITPQEIKNIIEESPERIWEFSEDDIYYGVFSSTTIEESSFNAETGELVIRASFKHYDDEINKFIDWIIPYLDKSKSDSKVEVHCEDRNFFSLIDIFKGA